MLTYERVLVPLDGSELAEAILPFAERVAGPGDAEVLLLRVVEPLSAAEVLAAGGVGGMDALLSREAEARRYLTAVARRLGDKGIRVRTEVRLGAPAAEIASAAAAWGADLVAMTTHGRSGLGRALFGSVAQAVLGAASVPVLMIRMAGRGAPAAAEAVTR